MFERQLGLRENPFLSGHQPKYVYPSREHQEALAHLRYGIQNREPFVLITGEVGTGKTTAVYDALAEWGARAVVALITNSALTRSELLEEICLRFGVAAPAPMSKPQTLVQLERLLSAVRARGELAILLLDEAQNLDRELLEEIRLLSNLEVQGEKLLQIFLVGQPELEAKLAQSELRQLRQRIAIHYRISPLSSTETAHYIHHRVAVAGGNANDLFPIETCLEIFRVTNGIPREINIVAGQSLLNAFVEDARIVTAAHVQAVEKEIEFQSVLKQGHAGMSAAPPLAEAMPRIEPAPYVPGTPPPPVVRSIEAAPPRHPEPMRPPDPVPVARPFEPAPVARVESPPRAEPPARPAPAEPAILPAWFDEVMARQKATDEVRAERPAAEPATPPVQREAGPPRLDVPMARVEPRYEPARIEPVPRGEAGRLAADPIGAPLPPAEPVRRPSWEEPGRQESTVRGNVIPMPNLTGRVDDPEAEAAEPVLAGVRAGEGNASIDFISPRLRAKLEDAGPERPRARVTSWLVAALIIAIVAIGAVLLLRFGPWSPSRSAVPAEPVSVTAPESPQATPPANPASATPAGNTPDAKAPQRSPSTGAATPSGSSSGTAAAPSRSQPTAARSTASVTTPARSSTGSSTRPAGASGTTTTRPAPTTTTSAATAKPDAAPIAPRPATNGARFGIAVGTYLNQERANAELTTLTQSTQLPAQLVTVSEDSVAMYRVVMGSFTDRVGAERAASDLIRRGLVNEARVIGLARANP